LTGYFDSREESDREDAKSAKTDAKKIKSLQFSRAKRRRRHGATAFKVAMLIYFTDVRRSLTETLTINIRPHVTANDGL
jgi:hypothetical protein